MRAECERYRDQAILGLYGESSGGPPDHAGTCPRCGRLEEEWRVVIDLYRETSPPAPPVGEPPFALVKEMRSIRSRRRPRARLAAGVLAFLILFGAATMDPTRGGYAHAMTDGEVFWTLRTLNGEADRIRRTPDGYESRPFFEDISTRIRELDRRLDEARTRLEELR